MKASEVIACLESHDFHFSLEWGSNGVCQCPRVYYLFGGVGPGKTGSMDLFYAAAPASPKRRAHFQVFMLEMHRWIDYWRTNGGTKDGEADPIFSLAANLASKAFLLCFDEFEVRDVGDVLIMRYLSSALWGHNVVVVMTFNWSPDDIYLNGL
ncbi:MAG: AFG1/ZapE family ATPase [Alphaproteobacteria bacterium]